MKVVNFPFMKAQFVIKYDNKIIERGNIVLNLIIERRYGENMGKPSSEAIEMIKSFGFAPIILDYVLSDSDDYEEELVELESVVGDRYIDLCESGKPFSSEALTCREILDNLAGI